MQPRRRYACWTGLAVAGLLALVPASPSTADAGDEALPPPQVIVRKGRRHLTPPRAIAPRPQRPPRSPTPLPPPVRRAPIVVPPRQAERPTTPSTDVPFLPPDRPLGQPEVRPGDVTFEVARPGGLLRPYLDGPQASHRIVLVMLGNPRVLRPAHVEGGKQADALSIKANTIVAWADRRGIPELDAFAGVGGRTVEGTKLEPSASVIPDFLEGIYAEGAVELRFGALVFRAERLYLEPKTYKALLIEPRFDGRSIGIQNSKEGLPLHVRARRARLVAKGLTIFDDAEVSASRADDRIALQVKTLSVEELNAERDENGRENPHALGYQGDSSQWYSGRALTFRGERVPFFWLPRADFGVSSTTESLTSPIRGIRTGRKSEVGRFGFLRVGTKVGEARRPLLDLAVEGGGYLDRGPAGGVDITWKHLGPEDPVRGFGKLRTWGVLDGSTFDSDGTRSGHDVRGRITGESRTWLRDDLTLDVEFATFSDRGFNNEFFERDDLSHKDRESYARLRWAPAWPGNVVGTLDAKWQQRPFFTETAAYPQVGLWVLPVPLLTPQARGGLTADMTSVIKAGYLGRRFDDRSGFVDYEAWRAHTDTRVNVARDVGDVRFSAYVGGAGTTYQDRTDGFRDLTRTALLAGVRANLQMHRTTAAQGGWFQLDGLRHVVDTDLELGGRFWDSHGPQDVPFFDDFDAERERSAATLRVRNRWQTRRRGPDGLSAGRRSVADVELALMGYLDDKGPYGRQSAGAAELHMFSEPREGLELGGELTMDFDGGMQTGSLGAGARTSLRGKPLRLFGGVRYVRHRSMSLTADLSWRFSEKYGVRFLQIVDFDDGENLSRLLLRRHSEDHIIVFGFSIRNGEDVNFEFSLEPAIGGVTTKGSRAFKDEPDLDPWGTLSR